MKKVILLMLIVVPVLLKAQQKTGTMSPLAVAPLYPLVHKTTPVFSSPAPSFKPVKVSSPVGPRDYYQQCFGYFCKKEWNWEKQTKIPVKLRLGSYQEAQRLEGKR